MHCAIRVDQGEPTLRGDHHSAGAARPERRRDRPDMQPVPQSAGWVH
jgi:hypothetical protein